jgi:ABC-2 type transport system permease protein
MIAAAGSTLWLLKHDLRLAGRDMRAAGKGRSRVVAGILLANIVLMHILGFVGAPVLARLHDHYREGALVTVSLGIAGAFTLFLSKAISEATEALHQRGDLDLLLSSPLPMRRVLITRLLAIAVIAGFLPILIVVPIVNGMILRGYFAWAGAYPVLISLALTASSAGAAITFGLLAWVGPRTTKLVARALATLFGAVSFLSTQARYLLPDHVRTAFWDAVTPAVGVVPLGPQWWPARATLGEPLPMLALALVGAGAVMLTSRGLGQVYGAGVLNNLSQGAGVRAGGVARRFRGGVDVALIRKEFLLLLRHPGLGAHVFYQFVFLVPGAIALVRVGHSAGTNTPAGLVFLTALMTGRIAKILAAPAFETDQAQALAATAPIAAGRLLRAKIIVTTAALLVVGGLPLVGIAWRVPEAFPAAFLSCVGASTTRLWLAAARPRTLRKAGLQGRLQLHGDGLLGVIIDIAWGLTGAVLTIFI